MNYTHTDLVAIARRWLLGTAKCSFALCELTSHSLEIPDAIGWRNAYSHSILIECKTSVGDFRADHKKRFRKRPGIGMGNERYYMAPRGIIDVDKIPENWGLLEVAGRKVFKVKKSARFTDTGILRQERRILCSALRRVHLRGDLEKIYEPFRREA